MSSILQALAYHPNAVGSLSQFFQSVGQTLPSPLLMPSTTWVFYLSDEICAIPTPILVTIDARSTTIRNIERAAERSAETWKAHFAALAHHHFVSLGMASDRGLGLVAGSQAACAMALWVADSFHELQDLFALLDHWERKAYAAMHKADDAARTFAHATSEANLPKRLQQYDTAHDAGEQAVTLYDHLDVLLPLRREAFHVCSPQGQLRTQEHVRSELRRLFAMMGALDCTALPPILQPIGKPIDAL